MTVRRGLWFLLLVQCAFTRTEQLQRGKEIVGVVSSSELYQAYQEIKQEYQEKAFRPSNAKDWKVLHRSGDGIEISMMKHPSDPSCPYVRMKAKMPTPIRDCWQFLSLTNWDRTMPKMDPFYEGLSVFGEYREGPVHMLLARKRTKRVFGFGKRDFCFVSVSDVPQPDGTWISGTVSVRTDQVPRRPGYTRAYQDSIAFYKPVDNGKKTQITIVFRIDMNDSTPDGEGGFMPMWIYVKNIGKIGAQSVKSMQKCLDEELKEKDSMAAASETSKGVVLFPWRPKPMISTGEPVFEREDLADADALGIDKKGKPPLFVFPWGKAGDTDSAEKGNQQHKQMRRNPFLPRRKPKETESQSRGGTHTTFPWKTPWKNAKVSP